MKRFVIIGGTGTLGKELARQLQVLEPARPVTIFSRDELKQKEMRAQFPRLRYVLGDVRDRGAVREVLRDAEAVFLLAAMKHIEIAEENPLEAVKTNILGAVNVAEEAAAAGVRYVVFSNTDKATQPITTYGYTKALAQNYLLSRNGEPGFPRFSVFSWGNIAASRGSVIPLFVRSLLEQRRVVVTDPRMSRFWLRIDDAAAFLLANYQTAATARAMVPPVKGASILRVAKAIATIIGVDNYAVETSGLRCTEKLHEVLEATPPDQILLRSDTCEQYSDDELVTLLRDAVLELADGCSQPIGIDALIPHPPRLFIGRAARRGALANAAAGASAL